MTTAVTVRDDESALELLKQALAGRYENDIVELNFDHWPVFTLNVKGDRYDSTITSGMMRALIELQRHLNRVYAEVVYGKSAKALTAEEREHLEIVFKVEQGSSNVVADLSGFFTELGKSAMEKMTGKQVVTTVLGIGSLLAAAAAFDGYTTSIQKTQEEQNRHDVTMALLAQNDKLREYHQDQVDTMTNILKSVPDAQEVSLPGAKFTASDIETITRQERQTTELKRIDGEYTISSFKKKPDSFRIEITRSSDGKTFATELFKGHLSMAEMDAITSALTSDQTIRLNVVGRLRGDVITSAAIVGVDNMANGSEVDARSVAVAPNQSEPPSE